jgi:hypothetical protein
MIYWTQPVARAKEWMRFRLEQSLAVMKWKRQGRTKKPEIAKKKDLGTEKLGSVPLFGSGIAQLVVPESINHLYYLIF